MTCFSESIRSAASGTFAKAISGIESFVSHMAKVSASNRASMSQRELQGLPPDECAHAYLQFIYGIYAAKLFELADALVASANEERFLVFSYCGRGLLETTATLRYYNVKIGAIIDAASDRDRFRPDEYREIIDLVDAHARGGRFDWARYWEIGRSEMAKHLQAEQKIAEKERGQNQSNPRQVNAKTSVEAWAKQEPGIRLL